ncbi:MAG: hypothetical protein LBR51_04095 [Bacteroidales bacterium]|nr:hypothetical protein [Bacteroidales bacterium]
MLFFIAAGLFLPMSLWAQEFHSKDPQLNGAFQIAMETLLKSKEDGQFATCAKQAPVQWVTSAWNAASLCFPKEVTPSLLNINKTNTNCFPLYIMAVWHHYLVTGDMNFLQKIWATAPQELSEIETNGYDKKTGLFLGNLNISVTGQANDKFLSTNCLYYEMYRVMAQMSVTTNGDNKYASACTRKAEKLKKKIRARFFNEKTGQLFYCLDAEGKLHAEQEGLGLAFVGMYDILSRQETRSIIDKAKFAYMGLPVLFSPKNMQLQPAVNAFFSDACHKTFRVDFFEKEWCNLANLVMKTRDAGYAPSYDATSGVPVALTTPEDKCVQLLSATAFARMVFNYVLGMEFSPEGLTLDPDMDMVFRFGITAISGIPYRNAKLNIVFSSDEHDKNMIVHEGREEPFTGKAFISPGSKGNIQITFPYKTNIKHLQNH